MKRKIDICRTCEKPQAYETQIKKLKEDIVVLKRRNRIFEKALDVKEHLNETLRKENEKHRLKYLDHGQFPENPLRRYPFSKCKDGKAGKCDDDVCNQYHKEKRKKK